LFSAATCKGVDPLSVFGWSLFAPAFTRKRTIFRCPSSTARCKGEQEWTF
jgi:hypothetical protein